MSIFREFKFKYILVGLVLALFVTLTSLFLISIIMYYADIDSSMASPLASIGLILGCFVGGFYTSKKHEKKGLIIGFTTSAIFFIILSIASLSISTDNFGLLSLIHSLVMLLSGGIGGILGVNNKRKIKI